MVSPRCPAPYRLRICLLSEFSQSVFLSLCNYRKKSAAPDGLPSPPAVFGSYLLCFFQPNPSAFLLPAPLPALASLWSPALPVSALSLLFYPAPGWALPSSRSDFPVPVPSQTEDLSHRMRKSGHPLSTEIPVLFLLFLYKYRKAHPSDWTPVSLSAFPVR